MKKFLILIGSVGIAAGLCGCVRTTGHSFLEDMPASEVASFLVAHKTTKEQVRSRFGDPAAIDFTDNGNETWVYTFTKRDSKGVNFVPIVNTFYSGTNDTTKNLKICFNTQGILEKYAFSSSQGETTRLGPFQ